MNGKELGGLALSTYQDPDKHKGSACESLKFSIGGNEIILPIEKIRRLEIGSATDSEESDFYIAKRAVMTNDISHSGIFADIYVSGRLRRIYKISTLSIAYMMAHGMPETFITDIIADRNVFGRYYTYNTIDILDLDYFRTLGNDTAIFMNEIGEIFYILSNDRISFKNSNTFNVYTDSSFKLDIAKYNDGARSVSTCESYSNFKHEFSKIGTSYIDDKKHLMSSSVTYTVKRKNEVSGFNVVVSKSYSDTGYYEAVTSFGPDINDQPNIQKTYHKYNGKFYLNKCFEIKLMRNPYNTNKSNIKQVTVTQYCYGKGHKLNKIIRYCKVSESISTPPTSSKGFSYYSKATELFRKNDTFEIGEISVSDKAAKVYGESVFAHDKFCYTDVYCDMGTIEFPKTDTKMSLKIKQRVYSCNYTGNSNPIDPPIIDVSLLSSDTSEESSMSIFSVIMETVNNFIDLLWERFCTATSNCPYYGYGTLVCKSIIVCLHIGTDFIKYTIDIKKGSANDYHIKLSEAAIRNVQYDNMNTNLYCNLSDKESVLNYFAKSRLTGITNLLSTNLESILDLAEEYKSIVEGTNRIETRNHTLHEIIKYLFEAKYGLKIF